MVIVKIQGGLGNQMFQYAFGKKIAKQRNEKLLLDITHYKKQYGDETKREYRLGAFNIDAEIANDSFLHKKGIGDTKSIYEKKLLKASAKVLQPLHNVWEVKEVTYRDNPEAIVNHDGIVYLSGYWQDPAYFENIKSEIRSDFTLKKESLEAYTEILEKIETNQSVLIQVRRGDYVSNPTTNNHHGVIGKDFYKKAIEFITNKLDSPHFFITSNGADWCRKNITHLCEDNPVTYITDIESSDTIEMMVMSRCNHFIIGNSTYPWWPAWLTDNPDKIVIAPKQWFADKEANKKCHIKPDSWIEM